MTDHLTDHLTEFERQSMADESLGTADRPRVEAHLRTCAECAADIKRLRALLALAKAEPVATFGDQWPAIRARIDGKKSASLGGHTYIGWGGRLVVTGLVAAGLLAAVLLGRTRSTAGPSSEPFDTLALGAAADSARMYDEQAKALLAQLELSRAMLRPEAVRAIDRDLAVVDSAITEVRVALAKDPRNAQLERMLAESLRHKVDILRSVGNAG
jgi:anti-sigma factor RsiW